jgi:hypothetical protein
VDRGYVQWSIMWVRGQNKMGGPAWSRTRMYFVGLFVIVMAMIEAMEDCGWGI